MFTGKLISGIISFQIFINIENTEMTMCWSYFANGK